MRKPPKTVLLSDEQYDGLIQKAEQRVLSDEDWKLLVIILKAHRVLLDLLRYQKTTVQKLKDLLFGKRTEKNNPPKDKDEPPPDNPGDPGGPLPEDLEVATEASATQEALSGELDDFEEPATLFKHPGHGRRGNLSWENAEIFFHRHSTLRTGEPCPKCHRGTLYQYTTPGVWVRYVGQAPLAAEVHKLERLRCSGCTEVFTATPPEELRRNSSATPEARAVAAVIKYQAATPFNRFAQIQKSFGQCIPRTAIWTLCKEMSDYLSAPYFELEKLAAQGDLVQNDDTTVRILALMKENKTAEQVGKPLKRTGMFTTGLFLESKSTKSICF